MRKVLRATEVILASLATLASLLTLSPTAAAAAGAPNPSMEAEFARLLNHERTSRGLPALRVSTQMREVSVRWSGVMSQQNHLHHNPNLAREIGAFDPRWQRAGENVGRGYSVSGLHDALMNSPGHRANILGTWNYVSVGVVLDGNRVWVTQNFLQTPSELQTTTAPSSAPAPREAVWLIRGTPSPGVPERAPAYGLTSYQTLSCDWDGNGTDTLGVYSNGTWYLRNDNNPGAPHIVIRYGWHGPTAVCGDWNGDGEDTIGLYHAGQWLLRDSNIPGNPDRVFNYGWAGAEPVVGAWSGSPAYGIGVYFQGAWYLRDTASPGGPHRAPRYGYAGASPVVGDWDGNGTDSIGVYDTGRWMLRQDTAGGHPQVSFDYGWNGTRPVTGDWNGSRLTGISVIEG